MSNLQWLSFHRLILWQCLHRTHMCILFWYIFATQIARLCCPNYGNICTVGDPLLQKLCWINVLLAAGPSLNQHWWKNGNAWDDCHFVSYVVVWSQSYGNKPFSCNHRIRMIGLVYVKSIHNLEYLCEVFHWSNIQVNWIVEHFQIWSLHPGMELELHQFRTDTFIQNLYCPSLYFVHWQELFLYTGIRQVFTVFGPLLTEPLLHQHGTFDSSNQYVNWT